ncbi:MAG: salicylate hydroxylase [Lentinula lateritia]|nr:MAG: salicylate hydroxylase [Lentinula lateritia]
MTEPTKFRIAILGGGIGGLACAVALKDHTNIEIDVYEQAAQITEIGAGVTVWPRTWEILKLLGLEEDLSVLLKEPPSNVQKVAFEMRLSDRKKGFTFRKIFTRDGGFCFHRSNLQSALLRQIVSDSSSASSSCNCKIHLSHRLERCEETNDSVKLFFENGYSTSCDMAIGADGIKSVVREYVVSLSDTTGLGGQLIFTGSKAFRGLVTRERFERLFPNHRALVNAVMYNGKSKHIVVYPINGGKLINIAAFISQPEGEGKVFPASHGSRRTKEEMLDAFSGWEPEAIQLLSTIENPSCWPIQDLHPLKTYTTRRILLLGDAAHAMTPHLGAGAGQAIEDGFVLGYLFSKLIQPSCPDPQSLLHLIKIYDKLRRPFANHLQKNSRKQGYYNELNMPEFDDIHYEGQELDAEQIVALGCALRENWDSWWQDCALKDLEEGLEMLRVQAKM